MTQAAEYNQTAPGRSAPIPPPPPGQETSLDDVLAYFTPVRIVKIAIIAALFLWLFWGTLHRLALVWWTKPDWSHGLLIPFFSIGVLYYIRDRWLGVPLRPSWWGLGIMAFSLLMYLWATWWIKAIMFQDYSWWVMLVGLVVALTGWRFFARVWFPIFFILFAIRIGGVIYNPISSKMQQIAAYCAALVMQLVGMQADLTGVVITIFTHDHQQASLQVAEACSGMKILMAFMALGALIAYVVRRPWWHRGTLLLATIPIAIIANVIRVVTMGTAHYWGRPDLVSGWKHTATGLLMLPEAFLLFLLLHWVLCKLVVEEDEEGNVVDDKRLNREPVRVTPNPDRRRSAPENTDWDFARIAGKLIQPHFMVVAGLLLLAAISWNAVNKAVGAFWVKEPVPLKHALDRFPARIDHAGGGYWQMDRDWVRAYGVLDEEIEQTLGAKHPTRLRPDGAWGDGIDPDTDDPAMREEAQYIQRTYYLMGEDGEPVDRTMTALFFISYYTGEPDVVPHVPERCYLGGGYTENVDAGGYPEMDFAGHEDVSVRRVQFFGKSADQPPSNVIYFFGFNGQFEGNHNIVRLKLNTPLGKYAYYSKIEVKFPFIEDPQQHQEAAELLLKDFMPVLLQDFLPDWEKYE